MKKTLFKIRVPLVLALAVFLSLGAVGCGRQTGGSSTTAANTTVPDLTAAATTAPDLTVAATTALDVAATTADSVVMTDSYAQARESLSNDAGILLPALPDLVAEYMSGSNSYMLDIVDGENLSFDTFQVFYEFFTGLFGTCDEGFPSGSAGTTFDAQWTVNGRWIQLYWNGPDNPGIFINVVG